MYIINTLLTIAVYGIGLWKLWELSCKYLEKHINLEKISFFKNATLDEKNKIKQSLAILPVFLIVIAIVFTLPEPETKTVVITRNVVTGETKVVNENGKVLDNNITIGSLWKYTGYNTGNPFYEPPEINAKILDIKGEYVKYQKIHAEDGKPYMLGPYSDKIEYFKEQFIKISE